jgi:type I restriction enzyme M protein
LADQNLSSFIWSVADLLRGDYKQSEYGKVILPFTVLRRLDCVLEPTKAAVLAEHARRKKDKVNPEPFLLRKGKVHFFNTSPLDMKKLMGDQMNIDQNLRSYIQAFSGPVRDIFESFDFETQIDRLKKAGLLYLVTEKFAGIDLHPDWRSTPTLRSTATASARWWRFRVRCGTPSPVPSRSRSTARRSIPG